MSNLLQEHESPMVAKEKPEATLNGNSKMTRSDVEAELIARCQKDGKFALQLFGFEGNFSSRLAYGQAIARGLGISLSDFLQQIEKVQVLQETPTLLYLVLPVCHLGCQVSPVIAAFQSSPSCPVCGMFRGQCANSTTTPEDIHSRQRSHLHPIALSRTEIEGQLIIKAQQEPLFKQKLLSQGKEVIVETVKEWGLNLPAFLDNIMEVRVVEETPNLLYIVFPANTPLGRLARDAQ